MVLYRTSTLIYLGIYSSEKRNMLVAEKFIRYLEKYGKHSVQIEVLGIQKHIMS